MSRKKKRKASTPRRTFDRLSLVLTLVAVSVFAIFTGYLVGQYAISYVAEPLSPATQLDVDRVQLQEDTQTTSARAQSAPESGVSSSAASSPRSATSPTSTGSSSPSSSAASSPVASSSGAPSSSAPTSTSSSASASTSTPTTTATTATSSTTSTTSTNTPSSESQTIVRVHVGRFSTREAAVAVSETLKEGPSPVAPDAWVLFDQASGEYRVQVGAFSNAARAQQFVEELKARNLDAFIAR